MLIFVLVGSYKSDLMVSPKRSRMQNAMSLPSKGYSHAAGHRVGQAGDAGLRSPGRDRCRRVLRGHPRHREQQRRRRHRVQGVVGAAENLVLL
jgi:hypothetical protein